MERLVHKRLMRRHPSIRNRQHHEANLPGKEEAARVGNSDRGDIAEDLVVAVLVDLVVRAHVEEAARRVVRASAEALSVGKELDRVDV